MSLKPSILWFRQDLRLEDQPALHAAIAKGGPVIPLFIWAPEEEGNWAPGAANCWWLHHSLKSLQYDLNEIRLTLILRRQSSLEALSEIVEETGADAVYWNRRYEPLAAQRDAGIKAELHKKGIKAHIFNGSLLYDPWSILTKQSKPYQVFTPFWKACMQQGEPEQPLSKPVNALPYTGSLKSTSLASFNLLPAIHWDSGIKEHWQPGCKGADERLRYATHHVIGRYLEQRDHPALKGTSELSPYLHHGEISPRMIWHSVRNKFKLDSEAEPYLRQLIWREFAHYLLVHFKWTPDEPLYKKYKAFPWLKDERRLEAWQRGKTGFPIVDAGMRQLWNMGWMHNRVRMIAGSFLVKDLLLDWREGARWFWDTLVDADLANNTLGWQWVGGCGADAAPYFRVFNPILQGDKFDDAGEYVRKWVPELAQLPNKWIHKPWEAPQDILEKADITLGITYPQPIVDHAAARVRALAAYKQFNSNLEV